MKISKGVNFALFFFIPFSILLLSYALFGMYPFAKYTVLISDLNTQYAQFYSYLHDIFTEGKSVQYTFELGGGLNFIGTFAYYLSSPFSALLFFFDKTNVPEFILTITLVKVGCAGVTCGWFLFHIFGKEQKGLLLFSTAYALSGFVMAYSFHVMWLDGIILLPVVLIGVEKLLYKQNLCFFMIALTITFIANFYISFMLGIFTFLYFIIRVFSVYSIREIKEWGKFFILFCTSAGLAVGMAAWLIIPTYQALKSGPYTVEPVQFAFEWTLDPLLFYWKFLSGGYDSSLFGAPQVYISILALVLLPLYFLNKKINNKEKYLFTAVFIFIICSFGITFLNLAWHGNKPPNAYPYRFAFVFTMIMIVMAARAFQHLSRKDILPLWISYIIHMFLLFLLSTKDYRAIQSNILIINAALITITVLLLHILIVKPSLSRISNILLLSCTLFDITFNTMMYIQGMHKEMGYTLRSNYQLDKNVLEAIQFVNEQNKHQYRVSSNYVRTLNDSLQYSYPSFQTFNTMANGTFHKFLRTSGYSTSPDYTVANNNGDTLVLDSILNIRFKIDDGSRKVFGFDDVATFDYAHVLQNKYVIPFGYPLAEGTKILDEEDPFVLQEKLVGKNKGDLFKDLTNTKLSLDNVKALDEEGKYERIDKNVPGYISVQLTVPKEVQLYALIEGNKEITKVHVNDSYLRYVPKDREKGITDLGAFAAGETVTLKIEVENTFNINQTRFVGLDIDQFKNVVTNLQRQTMTVIEKGGTTVKGNLQLKNDSMFVFPIPYEKGWSIQVDGKDVPKVRVAEGLLGAEIGAGNHDVRLVFHSPGLRLGMIVSIVSIVLAIGLLILRRKAFIVK